jgi:thiamine biosynthesis lipoprotein
MSVNRVLYCLRGAENLTKALPRISQATAALLVIFTAGCRSTPSAPPLQRFEYSSAHMGTRFSITLFAPEQQLAESAAEAAFQKVAQLDDILSDYKADSELLRLSDSPAGAPVRISAELFDVLAQAEKFSKLSHGAFDATVGPVVRLWRFSRKRKVLPTESERQTALQAVGFKKLQLDRTARTATLLVPNMRLDVGGIAKGYAADQAIAVLKSKGINRALVAASGDIAVGDPPPGQRGWRVQVATMYAGTNEPPLLLRNSGVSTSGDVEQSIEIDGIRYSHIVNPVTGLGLTNRIQATIVGPNATTTDALATGVSVLGAERGIALINSLPRTEALIFVESQGKKRALTSRNFKNLPRPKSQ